MTPEQVHLVQDSFTRLEPRSDEFAATFYAGLFELDPPTRLLFSQDPAVQRTKFMAELGEIVRCISDFDAFIARARSLGAEHVAYGATHQHYAVMAVALDRALAAHLAEEFTAAMREAWRSAYDLVAEVMMQGAADAPSRT